MKKTSIFILSFIFVIIFVLAGCSKKITITFDGNGGELITGNLQVETKVGKEFSAPTFSREGYEFDGWSIDLSEINESCTIQAKWTREITVYFDTNGGNEDFDKIKIIYNSTVKNLPVPTKGQEDDYTFLGWKYNGSYIKNGDILTVDESEIILIATWQSKWTREITVYFDTNGGNEDFDKIKITYNSTVKNLPVPTKGQEDDYTFLGWKYNGLYIKNGDILTVDESQITLTATWQSNWTKPY